MTHPSAHRVLFRTLARAVRPQRRLTLSEWADAHRRLSSKGSSEPGPWRTARTPYLKEILDCLSDQSPVKRVVVMSAAQVGKTEVSLNWLGYILHHAPGPTLVVVPTLEVRKRWVRQRLDPLLTESPVLAGILDARATRASANAEDIKDFPGGFLVIGGANSPASLASMPIRYVVCDEVDRFPWSLGVEGDPLGLIEQRTATFPRRKLLLVSTPTIKDASRIEEEYNRSDRRRYHVPCPHCGEYQTLKWANLHWDKDAEHAWYGCEECGAVIDEHHKPAMLAAGRWIAENPDSPVRGYHLNGLYAPLGLGFRWVELAREWLGSLSDPAKLKRFINTTLGEVWTDKSRDIQPRTLQERAEDYEIRTAPPGCLVVTVGVDTQDDRLAVQVLGWGRGETAWVLDWLELLGNPGLDETWLKLADYLNRPITNAYGVDLRVQAVAIDSGGHYTHAVYHFVRQGLVRRAMAVKGSSIASKPVLSGRPTYQDVNWRGKVYKGKQGVALYQVGVNTAKHELYARLASDADQEPAARKVRFSKDLPDEYYSQLLAEQFDPEKNRFVIRRGRRNEGLDTYVYAWAAAHHPEVRVHAMRARDWDALARVLEPGGADSSAAPDAVGEDSPATEQGEQDRPHNPPEIARRKPKPRGSYATRWRL